MNLFKSHTFFSRLLFSSFLIFCFFTTNANNLSKINTIDEVNEMFACSGVNISTPDGKITVTYPTTNLATIEVRSSNCNYSWGPIVASCYYTGCPNTGTAEFLFPNGGCFVVDVKLYTQQYGWVCQETQYVTVEPGGGNECDNMTLTALSSSSIKIDGFPSGFFKAIQVFKTSNNQLVFECGFNGGNCTSSEASQTVSGLAASTEYGVNGQLYTNTYQYVCTKYLTVTTHSSSRIQNNSEPNISISGDKNISISDPIKLMPNPARDFLTIEIKSSAEANQLLRIYNMQGALVLQQPLQLFRGVNRVELEIADLPKGVYVLMPFGNATQSNRTRFVKI